MYATLSPPHVRTAQDHDRSREAVEARIVQLYAGELAAEYADPTPTGYLEESAVERQAAALAQELERLTPRHRELLQLDSLSDDPADLLSDEATAAAFSAERFPETWPLHTAWLRAVAEHAVRELMPRIVALAEALEARGYLSGAECAAIYHPQE
jgi:hypothetical protein